VLVVHEGGLNTSSLTPVCTLHVLVDDHYAIRKACKTM
jgi:hypothetical protein